MPSIILHPVARPREFVIGNYAEIKQANPGFPMLVRECAGIEAKLIARYGKIIHQTQQLLIADGLYAFDLAAGCSTDPYF